MKNWQRSVLFFLLITLLAGCASHPYTYTGAGIGGALGAGIGAAANHRNPWKGAAIGGLLGAAGGALAGEVYGRSNPSYPQGDPNYGYGPATPPPASPYHQPPAASSPYYYN